MVNSRFVAKSTIIFITIFPMMIHLNMEMICSGTQKLWLFINYCLKILNECAIACGVDWEYRISSRREKINWKFSNFIRLSLSQPYPVVQCSRFMCTCYFERIVLMDTDDPSKNKLPGIETVVFIYFPLWHICDKLWTPFFFSLLHKRAVKTDRSTAKLVANVVSVSIVRQHLFVSTLHTIDGLKIEISYQC